MSKPRQFWVEHNDCCDCGNYNINESLAEKGEGEVGYIELSACKELQLKTAQKWQPIETAPKDEIILLVRGVEITTGWWQKPANQWGNMAWLFTNQHPPTHWMPLPEPPKLDAKG